MSGGKSCNSGAAMLLVSMAISKTAHVFMHNNSFGCAKIGESNLFLISMDMGETAHVFMHNLDFGCTKIETWNANVSYDIASTGNQRIHPCIISILNAPMDGKPGTSMSGGTLCNPGAAMLLVSMEISETAHVFMHNRGLDVPKRRI